MDKTNEKSHGFIYAGKADLGYGREVNEDYVDATELDGGVFFAAVADGMGSLPSSLQPASIAVLEIMQIVRRVFESDKELFLDNADVFLLEAMHSANRTIGAFRKANEEKYAGFGASLTCCLLHRDESSGRANICFAHAGNTRLFLIRAHPQDGAPEIRQLTKDHTKAYRLYEDGVISFEQYHTHPDRLVCTSGLGNVADPEIMISKGSLKPRDIILMTSDGVHNAIRPEKMSDFVMYAGNCDGAVETLIQAAIMEKYVDNMSALMVMAP
jgi:serine/threonine protein phosphatase PrpC